MKYGWFVEIWLPILPFMCRELPGPRFLIRQWYFGEGHAVMLKFTRLLLKRNLNYCLSEA